MLPVSPIQLAKWREEAKQMFYHGTCASLRRLCAHTCVPAGYDNYMLHAFPLDELDPVHCKGRGPDYKHPENINVSVAFPCRSCI